MNPLNPDCREYELRFKSLWNPGRRYAFPCDAQGHVDLATLSDGVRRKYDYVRAVIGREFNIPAVLLCTGH